MSFDLFVFEIRENIKTSEDVINFMDEFTKYEEDKDYNSLIGCSENISNWAKKMFEKFPAMNGEYAPPDEIAYATEDSEIHLADYSFGKYGVYCSFSWSVDEEALEYVISTLDDYNMGMYNTQSNDAIYARNIEVLNYRTESTGDVFCSWENIEGSIKTIDSIERGNGHRDNNAFITVWFEKNGNKSEDYIQCMPIYEKGKFFKSIFGKRDKIAINGYFFEIMKDNKLYQTEVSNKEELILLMKAWCLNRTVPDTSKYDQIL